MLKGKERARKSHGSISEVSYKDTRAGLLNTEKRIYAGTGSFDIPRILPMEGVDITGLRSVGFNYFFSEKNPQDKILHFFLGEIR